MKHLGYVVGAPCGNEYRFYMRGNFGDTQDYYLLECAKVYTTIRGAMSRREQYDEESGEIHTLYEVDGKLTSVKLETY